MATTDEVLDEATVVGEDDWGAAMAEQSMSDASALQESNEKRPYLMNFQPKIPLNTNAKRTLILFRYHRLP